MVFVCLDFILYFFKLSAGYRSALMTCWKRLYSIGYPIRIKKKVAEQQNECMRHEEEISILEKEMKNFLVFYKTTIIARLKESETELLVKLNNGESCQ